MHWSFGFSLPNICEKRFYVLRTNAGPKTLFFLFNMKNIDSLMTLRQTSESRSPFQVINFRYSCYTAAA